MAKHTENSSAQEALPTTTKRAWPNPRLLLLIPALTAIGASVFFIVRRRSAKAEA